MNKKTFALALIFFVVTVLYLGFELYWFFTSHLPKKELALPVLFVIAASVMVWREFRRKKRKHVEDVKRYL